MQTIGRVDDLLGIVLGLLPARRARVDLPVEVEARQQHPCGGLVDTAITLFTIVFGFGLVQHILIVVRIFTDDGKQLALNPLHHLGAAVLLRLVGTDDGREGNIIIGIAQQVVLQGSQETDFCAHRGILVGKVLQIEVAIGDAGAQTVVVALEHRVAGIVGVVAELRDAGVAPAADGLIGGQLVAVPHLAEQA